MIPGQLKHLTWADIDRLVETEREEDDTIEFKISFKGSDDYAALNEKNRQEALDAIAREVIAFLNTRGGDLIIGIEEGEGPRPVAAAISLLKNPTDAADRVARGLSALIEPAQTNVVVRGISSPHDQALGVVVVRVQPSMRAPHRSRRTLNCYARRGTESVPMPMDEIQDLAVHRTRIRLEQLDLLDRQFDDFRSGKSGFQDLGEEIIHIRTVAFPYLEQELIIDDKVLFALNNVSPVYYSASGAKQANDVAFRGLQNRWRPILRGRERESYEERLQVETRDVLYSRKVIKENGIAIFDFAARSSYKPQMASAHFEWFVGYLAEVSANLQNLTQVRPNTLPATIRMAVRCKGEMYMAFGGGMWEETRQMPSDTFFVPDFAIDGLEEVNNFFEQAQVDLCSIMGVDPFKPSSLLAQNSEMRGPI